MKIINRLVAALMVAATLFTSQIHSQEFIDEGSSPAYEDSSYLSAALPVAALVVAAVVIATTNRHHHHSNGSGSSSSSSSSHFHAHSL